MEEVRDEGRRERKKRAAREAILAAARTCFHEKGFHGTTMADIAAAVDLSTQTVFNYFPSKDHLMLGLAETLTTRFEGILRELGEGQGGTFPMLTAMLADGGDFLEALRTVRRDVYVEMVRVVLTTEGGRPLVHRVDAAVSELLARNQAIGRARTDMRLEGLTQLVVNSVMGSLLRWMADPEVALEQQLVACAMFLHETIRVRPR